MVSGSRVCLSWCVIQGNSGVCVSYDVYDRVIVGCMYVCVCVCPGVIVGCLSHRVIG